MCMTIEEMRRKKKEFGYTYKQIAERTNLPLGTVQKVLCGQVESPRYATLAALEKLFRQKNGAEAGSPKEDEPEVSEGSVRESDFFYDGSAGRRHTVREWLELPEEKRVELIDGRFFDMASPDNIHQMILLELAVQLKLCAEKHDCLLMIAPCGVQLDEDEYTMLEPDLFVLCGERKKQLEAACTVGAPDLVIEVLSPSTRSKDMHIKGRKYMNAGVREYWMIDPRNKKVLIDRFSPMEGEREPDVDVSLYGFHDRIPVGIAEGACEVDFEKIWKKIAFLYAE